MNFLELTAVLGLDKREYDKGLDEASNKAGSFGSKMGSAIGGAVKVGMAVATAAIGAATTGITALTSKAVTAYGEYEQLVGGVSKLFGANGQTVEEYAKSVGKSVSKVKKTYESLQTAQDTVLKNADNAYKTAGMSANQYMETVTSFSAALIKGLSGNTVKAAKLADTAIRDMSDNANTFGSDIASIQAAYQGFAKQNYTMLDNLKLGYGGTKSEMMRLVKESGVLGKAGKDLTLKNFDQKVSYDKIVEAIHKVQTNMGIAGTTSREAEKTIQGSMNAMKSAWTNLLTGLGNGDKDLKPLIDNVVNAALTVVNNIKPIALQAVKGISTLIKEVAPIIEKELPPLIKEIVPALTSAAVALINALSTALPSLIGTLLPALLTAVTGVIMSFLQELPQILQILSAQLPVILQQIIPAILTLLPLLIQTGVEFIVAIGKGIADNIELLMDAVMKIIHYLVDELLTADNLEQFIKVALQIILAIAGGIIKNIPEILGAIAILFVNIIKAIGKSLPEIGAQIIDFVVNLGKHFGDKAFEVFGTKFYDILVNVKKWLGNIKTSIANFIADGIQYWVDFGKGIGEKIGDMFKNAKDLFSKGVEALKGLLKFNWELPKLKLPHFKLTGEFNLAKLQVPKVSIEWYKKAYDEPYILNGATIFGKSGDRLLGGGEGSGSEVVVGTSKLMSMMKQAVGINARPVTINIYGAEGQDIRELAKEVSKEIQNLINDEDKAYGLI